MSHDYPRFQFLTYAYDDPDSAPVLDVSTSIRSARREARERGSGGFLYRVEQLPESEWNGAIPAYGREEFIEVLK